ncbi:acetate--CoA ligase family protein [soil metagenome]
MPTAPAQTSFAVPDLDRFFRPRVVAVIGASDTEGRPNTAIWRRLRTWGERVGAAVHPVNPNRGTVDGVPCAPTVADVAGDIDVAVVLIGDALAGVADAIDAKARFAVVFSAGFAEAGTEGRAAQQRLDKLLVGSELRLLGPNTNLNAFEELRQGLTGPAIALVTQSGHQGRPVFAGQELGIRLSHWAPTGNEADLEFADFASWFADQPEVGAIAAYIEGFKDGGTLMRAADHAARRGVPITVVKVGRTATGRESAASHTGKLTGADAVTSAVFRQFGVTRVDGLDELLDTSALLARGAPPRTDGVCVYSISGGTSAHMADLCAAAEMALPALGAKTQEQLHQWIPQELRVSNPVDNGGHPVGDWRGRKILDAIVADPAVGVLICPITGAFPPMSDRLAQDLVDVAGTTDVPICVVWGSPVGTESAYRDVLLSSSKVVVFRTFANCVGAVRAYLDHHRFQARYRSPFAAEATPAALSAAPARAMLAERTGPLSEHDSKALLCGHGIRVTRDHLVTSAAAATRAAARLGYPVVLKGCGPGLAHKSELGLVAVGLTSARQVRAVFADLAERGRAAAGDGFDGVLVSEMVAGGIETVVGITQDDLFGPTVMVGLGGALVEVLGDVTFRVPPFDAEEVARMLRELRGFPLLTGVWGRPPADIDALIQAIMAIQRMAVDLAEGLAELDVNPLLVRPEGEGVIALDALAVARSTAPPEV